jgi:hypothetical protein
VGFFLRFKFDRQKKVVNAFRVLPCSQPRNEYSSGVSILQFIRRSKKRMSFAPATNTQLLSPLKRYSFSNKPKSSYDLPSVLSQMEIEFFTLVGNFFDVPV